MSITLKLQLCLVWRRPPFILSLFFGRNFSTSYEGMNLFLSLITPHVKAAYIFLSFQSLHACFFLPFLANISKTFSPPQILHTCVTCLVSVTSGLAPWQASPLHLGLAYGAENLRGHPPLPCLWVSARYEHVWETETQASEQ